MPKINGLIIPMNYSKTLKYAKEIQLRGKILGLRNSINFRGFRSAMVEPITLQPQSSKPHMRQK